MTKPFTEEQVPIDEVRGGDSLALPGEGGRRVLFQVENKIISSVQQPDGSHRDTVILESEPLQATGEPARIEFPVGAVVTRLRHVK
jgi:hypothetical protein